MSGGSDTVADIGLVSGDKYSTDTGLVPCGPDTGRWCLAVLMS